MYNLLLIEDEPLELKNMINIISKNFPEIRIYNISFDEKESLDIIREQIVDIIIISKPSYINILSYIEKNNFYKYTKSIVITSCKNTFQTTIDNNPYIFAYSPKTNNYSYIIKVLKQLILSKKNKNVEILIKNRINVELKKLNYNFNYNGTVYLSEVIYEIYKIRYQFDGSLEKNIYPIIARKYNKKVNAIYCNIKQATKIMLLDCPETIIVSYFNYSFFSKPKVKDIIFTILNKI